MTINIFLDNKGFQRLNHSIPAGSRSKFIVEDATSINFFGSNAVISCEDGEAHNLLRYAEHCPTVAASIHKALRLARLPIEKFPTA
jgi:hypothetical protein